MCLLVRRFDIIIAVLNASGSNYTISSKKLLIGPFGGLLVTYLLQT
jgi:hypothetical protein